MQQPPAILILTQRSQIPLMTLDFSDDEGEEEDKEEEEEEEDMALDYPQEDSDSGRDSDACKLRSP